MSSQTIDTYKLTSLEEPSDEVLSQLMKEAAEEARLKKEAAYKRYFDALRATIEQANREWKAQTAASTR